MGKKIVGIILGFGMMALAVGAFLSNEPASKTDFGRVLTLVIFVLGLSTAVSGLTTKKQNGTAYTAPVGPTCPSCHKAVSLEFTVCPYCGTTLKPKCPNCGKEVSPDFRNCPYCGTHLPSKSI